MGWFRDHLSWRELDAKDWDGRGNSTEKSAEHFHAHVAWGSWNIDNSA